MDKENKKIDINNFFDRTEEISDIAGRALQQSDLNASAIRANKSIIESLSITIEAMKTEIRDIANYIVIENKMEKQKRDIEKKIEKDRKEDEKFEAEDEKEKKEIRDKLLAMGKPIPKETKRGAADPVEQAKGGGSFLGGLLKAIAIGGLAALALPLVPVIAPLLLKAMAVGIAVIAGGLLIKKLAEITPQIYKTVKDGLAAGFKKISETVSALKENVVELGKQVGAFASKKFKQTLNLGKRVFGGIADFATGGIFDFDKKGDSKFDKFRQENIIDPVKKGVEGAVGDLRERGFKGVIGGIADSVTGGIFDFDKRGDSKFDEFRQENFIDPVSEKFKEAKDAVFNIGDAITDDEGKPKGVFRNLAGVIDFATGGRFDLDKRGSSTSDNISPLGRVINAMIPSQTNKVNPRVATSPSNTSEVIIRSTSSTIPFIRTVKNQFLSTSPTVNKLPPEVARLIR